MSSPQWKLIRRLQEAGLHKRIFPEPNLTSKYVNGVGTFIPPACKLVLKYNVPRPGAGGDSKGMVQFIQSRLRILANDRKYMEIVLQKKSAQPQIVCYYNNGTTKVVDTPKWKSQDIERMVETLCDSSGVQNMDRQLPRQVKRGTGSALDKISPSWNPFYAEKIFRP